MDPTDKTVAIPKAGRVVSYAGRAGKAVRNELEKRIALARTEAKRRVRKNISTPGGPGSHSKPGEFPRKITGKMRDGVDTKLTRGKLGFGVFSSAKHANWIEFGTKGGVLIRPVRAKMLSWVSGGRRYFARSVIQGAIRDRSYVRRTLVSMRAYFAKTMGKPFGNVTRIG